MTRAKIVRNQRARTQQGGALGCSARSKRYHNEFCVRYVDDFVNENGFRGSRSVLDRATRVTIRVAMNYLLGTIQGSSLTSNEATGGSFLGVPR